MESPDEKSPPVTTTGDTENSTHFHSNEGPTTSEDHRYALPMKTWERRKMLNEGTWNGPKRENKEVTHRQDNLHIYDAIACQLDLTAYQKERGRGVYDDLPLGDLGRPVKQYAFAVCIAVANADAEGKRYWPVENKQDNDPLFAEFGESLDLTLREQLSALMKVKSRTNL